MIGELSLIFVAGLLGSSHCIGMCGGFAVILGMTSRGPLDNLARQSAFGAGRIFTYSSLGALAGLLGRRLTAMETGWINLPAGLCLLAGLFLIVQGLSAAGFSLRRAPRGGLPCGGCLSGPLFTTMLQNPGAHNAFLAGVLTGFLPCGLVYAFLSLAASKGDPWSGLLVMGAFGLGTLPLMVVAGVGSTLLSLVARRRLLRAAAWCVVATGGLTVARGAGFLSWPGTDELPDCPFCAAGTPTPTPLPH
jgi:sulfite exporter TauE/SafE